MSQWYLLNKVVVGNQVVLPGEFYDDAVVSTTNVLAANGILWPASDTTVQAMAKYVANAHKVRGMPAEEMQAFMFAAAFSSVKTNQTTDEANIATNTAAIAALQGIELVHDAVDVPLATIQAQTSGTAFNVGSAFPANARLLGVEVEVVQTVTGGTISACTAKVGDATTDNRDCGSVDVFTATGILAATRADLSLTRSAVQEKLKLTSTGDTLAHATTGHLKVHRYYAVIA